MEMRLKIKNRLHRYDINRPTISQMNSEINAPSPPISMLFAST